MTSGDIFPLGLYCVEDPLDFPEIAAAGFNLVQPWRFEGGYDERYPATVEAALAYLDAAQEQGLRVFMSLPLYDEQSSYYSRFVDPDGRRRGFAAIRERVSRLRDHPALFGWYLFDEPDHPLAPVDPADLRRGYDEIKLADPAHPVGIASGIVLDESYPYFDCFDLFLPDPLEVPFCPPAAMLGPNLEAALRELRPRGKQVIQYVQIYNIGKDLRCMAGREELAPFARYPTLEEIRFMSYFALLRGARGVILNCFRFDYGREGGHSGDDISRGANPRQWEVVAQAAAELVEIGERLVRAPAVEPAEAGIAITPATPIEATVRVLADETLVVAVNPTAEPVSGFLQLDADRYGGAEAEVFPERARLASPAGRIAVFWEGHQARVIRLRPGADSVPGERGA